jgi:asparagine synthase (glutamine-hydrolysing)
MCRIAGVVSNASEEERNRIVKGMTGAMAHGGPDDEGLFTSGTVTLGHRRLSIIDLSTAGHQPMVHPAGHHVITYNGEIYNYRELRKELTDLGQRFSTQTDTEVIVNAYRQWGTASFGRLSGMFAFALLDNDKSLLYLVRDASGIKPLYYSLKAGRLVFASEVKAFRKVDPAWEEDPNWKTLFLTFGFLPHPITSLDGVRSLSPGSALAVNVSAMTGTETSFFAHRSGQAGTMVDVNERIRQETVAAVRRHLISDAPLGVFLSGGIDSSLLTLLASHETGEHLRTVSVNFADSTLDEGKFQQIVLDKISHHDHQSFVVTEQMFWEAWDEIWRSMDQPSIDGVNTYFVSQAAHQSGLKAVLSGLGADELFGGYGSFARISWIRHARRIPGKAALAKFLGSRKDALKRLVFLDIPGPVGDYLFLRGIHTPATTASILDCPERDVYETLSAVTLDVPEGLSDLDYASFLETNMYMRNQLLKDTDYMSMRFGLEVRVPFLDQDLVRTVRDIGLAGHYDPAHPKYLLTHAFADVLPDTIIHRKKQGFVFPFHKWLADGIREDRPVLHQRLHKAVDLAGFMVGRVHWSKTWSGVVLDNFKP